MTNRTAEPVTPWQARAAAWELLALTFRYPGAVLADALASGEWADAAREICAAIGAWLPEGWADDGADAGQGGVQELLRELRVEATRLFVGLPDPICSPYEGVWRAADDGVQALLFVNPHSMDVECFCRACGLGRPEGTNEPLDHIATECELLMFLALGANDPAALPDAVDVEALPGGSAAAAYEQFLRDHAAAWMPRFAEKVQERSRTVFYGKAGKLLEAVLQEELS